MSRSEDRRCEWSGSGESDAGSARSEARARGGNFRESGLLGGRRPGARKLRRSGPWYGEGAEGVRGSPLCASGTWKVRRDGSGSALRGVGSCARRRVDGESAETSAKTGRGLKTRDCRGWTSPFRTDGR